jgi:uncharacterized protein (TIGR02466 family)
MEKKILPLFSKVVSIQNLEFDVKKITSEVYKTKFREPPNEKQSASFKILDKKIFKTLKKPLMDEFYKYAHDMLKYSNQEFKITTSWLTKTTPGQDSDHFHQHLNSMFSGVLYLKTEPEKAKINFENFQKTGFFLMPTDFNVFNSPNYTLCLSEKDLIFFPSELYHRIEANDTNSDRLSLAFNIIPTNKFGSWDSTMDITVN